MICTPRPEVQKLHFVSESAMEQKRRFIADEITRCAQELTDARGLDGFTMDELAECAGVSRRTLFNYVPGKMDAVLGVGHEPEPEMFTEFLAGGPTGELIPDIRTVMYAVVESKDAGPDDVERMRRLIASDPRIHQAARDRFERVADYFAGVICAREGVDFDAAKARIVATITLGLFDLALDAFTADPGTTLAQHFGAAFDTAVAIFN
jgi:AcrR family transcriptional regulator